MLGFISVLDGQFVGALFVVRRSQQPHEWRGSTGWLRQKTTAQTNLINGALSWLSSNSTIGQAKWHVA